MTDSDLISDSLGSYTEALAAMRLRLVVRGEVIPRPDEPIDLLMLSTLPNEHGALPDTSGRIIAIEAVRS